MNASETTGREQTTYPGPHGSEANRPTVGGVDYDNEVVKRLYRLPAIRVDSGDEVLAARKHGHSMPATGQSGIR